MLVGDNRGLSSNFGNSGDFRLARRCILACNSALLDVTVVVISGGKFALGSLTLTPGPLNPCAVMGALIPMGVPIRTLGKPIWPIIGGVR